MGVTRRALLLSGLGGVALVSTAVLSSAFDVASPERAAGPVESLTYPVLAAHRGAAFVHPENTITAFEQVTKDHPGITLEMDVRQLGDGTLVLFHDDAIDRLSADGRKGKLSQLTARDWSSLRIKHPTGGKPATAATLAQVLDRFAGTDTVLVIELKDAAAADAFIETVHPHREQVIVQSFDSKIVSRFARSGLHTLQLTSEERPTLVDGIHSVGVQWDKITTRTVTDAHAKGVKVWAWGNEVTRVQFENHDRGLDGYMVDDPTH